MEAFAQELAQHPDIQAVSYVIDGLQNGFRLGFNRAHHLKPARKNLPPAYHNQKVIDTYLAKEVSLGRVAGPFASPPMPQLQISSFGVIPKKGQPGKWRLIVDLSSPTGQSVNDGINSEEWSLHYITLDEIITMISNLGQGALMAKFDVESAYRNVAVHPADRFLLGMKWRGLYYVDLALPFGLRSAPYIFNSVATMVEWILTNNYAIPNLLHYLDDFITTGPPSSPLCQSYLNTALEVCKHLGLPLHPNKCVGPLTRMVVLGIELDSANQIARLPDDKLQALRQLLQSWNSRRWCNRNQLESLIGHLHHAAKVVWPGRTFIRRMIDLLSCFRRWDHPIRLNMEFRRDLQWWQQFVGTWNGVSFWHFPGMRITSDLEVTSDAAGAIGYGAYWGSEWFNGRWSQTQEQLSIAYKELFPIVISAHIWGRQWARKTVLFRSDNEAVVHILNSRTSRDPGIMHILRSLLLAAAQFNFTFTSCHVPGVQNKIADALSRFNWQVFHQLAPRAQSIPVAIPTGLLEALANPH